MEETQINTTRSSSGYVGDNQIGENGCKHLSKAAWRELEEIVLSNFSFNSDSNIIGDRGCYRLICGGGWSRMKKVFIRIPRNILVGCGLREEGCRSLAKEQGNMK